MDIPSNPEELNEKYSHVFQNQTYRDIAHWRIPNVGEEADEAAYVQNAINGIKGLKEKFLEVASKISEH